MKVKVHGGTAADNEPSLCLSCRHATIVKGRRASQEIIRCGQVESRITFPVTSCTTYVHKAHPTLWAMEDIAWVLRTDLKKNHIGFVRAKDLRHPDRHVLDEE